MQQNKPSAPPNDAVIRQALIEAVHKNDMKRVRTLLDAGANVDGRWDHSESPLMAAAGDTNEAMVVFLLSRNAPVNVSDYWGGTPLVYAAIAGSLPIVRILLAHKAVVNVNSYFGTHALTGACGYGYTDIAALLLKSGAKIDAADKGNGMTALMQAVHEHKHECVKRLLAKGADKFMKDKEGATALDMAQKSKDAKSIALLSR